MCGIGSSGGVELGAALERNKTLRYLDLSGNELGDDGVRGLSAGLENNSSLEEVWLHGDKSLGEEGATVLWSLKRRPNLKMYLDKVYKYLSLSGAVTFHNVLLNSKSVPLTFLRVNHPHPTPLHSLTILPCIQLVHSLITSF